MYQALRTFIVKPTDARLPPGSRPDELKFDWGTLPGVIAQIYLPEADAAQIRATAQAMYGVQPFTLIDAHTLGCPVRGRTYMPIPTAAAAGFAGLLSVELPEVGYVGQTHRVTVSRITSPVVATAGLSATASVREAQARWRKVTGLFQLPIEVGTAAAVVERQLASLRWIFEAVAPSDPWYPVFARHLGLLAAQVTALGGHPAAIAPSSNGLWPPLKPCQSSFGGVAPMGAAERFTGKVEDLVFDRFGDFAGFTLRTDLGEHRRFDTGDGELAKLMEWARNVRIRLIVVGAGFDYAHPVSLRFLKPGHVLTSRRGGRGILG